MSNVCECKEEMGLSTKGNQPTFKDILAELNRLKLENKCLKADKQELQKEVIQLRNDKQVLHNKSNENSKENDDIGMLNEYEEEYLCGCESEEDLKTYEEALNNCSIINKLI